MTGAAGILIGTYTRGGSEGVYAVRMDAATSLLGPVALAAKTDNPALLAASRSGKFVYAVNETTGFEGRKTGSVSAYSVDERTGELELLNCQPSGGAGPCHISLDPSGKVALVANYVGGSACVLPVDQDGRLGTPGEVVVHRDPAGQRRAHVHSMITDPTGEFILVADLGLDKVFIYRLDAERARMCPAATPAVALPTGAGPRHFAFHPAGTVVYLVNELNSTVTALAWDAQAVRLEELQTVSTLPPGFSGSSAAAEVQVHPSGRFLFASNRGHDSIAVFTIQQDSKTLSPVRCFGSGGRTPRHFTIAPDGRHLVAANQDSDSIVVFRIDDKSGSLEPTGMQARVPCPVCVIFRQ